MQANTLPRPLPVRMWEKGQGDNSEQFAVCELELSAHVDELLLKVVTATADSFQCRFKSVACNSVAIPPRSAWLTEVSQQYRA
jgi:hypothetical protein